jgi:hypothetical protein
LQVEGIFDDQYSTFARRPLVGCGRSLALGGFSIPDV